MFAVPSNKVFLNWNKIEHWSNNAEIKGKGNCSKMFAVVLIRYFILAKIDENNKWIAIKFGAGSDDIFWYL